MKKIKKISALLLAMIMTLSMAVTAFADDEVDVTDPVKTVGNGSATITSNFVFAEGLSVPGGENGVTFNYTITATGENKNDAPANPTIEAVNFKDSEKTEADLKDGLYTLSKKAAINFGTFTHAGVYEYDVERVNEAVKDVEHCESKYRLRVWVENDNGNLKTTSITAVKLTDEGVLPVPEEKLGTIEFTHTYRKMGSLTITKNTVSPVGTPDVADKTKAFNFAINFTKSPTVDEMTAITGTIQDKAGNYLGLDGAKVDEANKDLTFHVGTDSTVFKLKDGDFLTFDEVPVGTTYKAVEPHVGDGYTQSVSVWENGVQTVTDRTFANNENADATVKGKEFALVGEKENKVVFTNTYDSHPVTGIIMNNLPFILLIALGICALGLLAVSGKRRSANR